ncbi:MAG: hypothetical protein WCW16_03935, partial [Candidatus Magasanikbacteria bacterium]
LECVAAADCDDSDVCTTNSCQANACVYTPVVGCCHQDSECDTESFELCVSTRCEIPACDEQADCDPYAVRLGFIDTTFVDVDFVCDADVDCAAHEYCDPQTERCTTEFWWRGEYPVWGEDFGCVINRCGSCNDDDRDGVCDGPEPTPCENDADCDDGNVATTDVCQADGTCSNQAPPPASDCHAGQFFAVVTGIPTGSPVDICAYDARVEDPDPRCFRVTSANSTQVNSGEGECSFNIFGADSATCRCGDADHPGQTVPCSANPIGGVMGCRVGMVF